ncbi:MAG TPA: TatD family hydrolase [Mycobacteriales bacterium]|nr:TatD family hydrolase [Mycobacteriales bacterium]
MSRAHGRQGDPVPPPEALPVPVVDAHCHLDLTGGDVGRQVELARSVGVRTVVSIGIDVTTSRWQAEIAAEHEDVWAAVAVHPNEAGAGAATAEALDEIARLAALPQVRAVGETGLDYYRTDSAGGQAEQERSFRAHIAIAKQSGKALVIHDREAHDDVLRVLAEEGAPEVTVIHAFSGDADFARRCAAAGYYMSFAGNVSFKNAANLREAAAVVPAGLLLVETDAPFLTPMPFRGRPNGSHLIPLTMRVLAETRGEQLEVTCAAVAANATRVFALEKGHRGR